MFNFFHFLNSLSLPNQTPKRQQRRKMERNKASSLNPKQVEWAYLMVHDHFQQHLPDFDAWKLRLDGITEEMKAKAFTYTKMPLWRYSIDELVVLLSRELPHLGGDKQCFWDTEAFHMLSPRLPDNGKVKMGTLKGISLSPPFFKDVVYLLVCDGATFVENHCAERSDSVANAPVLQVVATCSTAICFAPEHLTLETRDNITARAACHENLDDFCVHVPRCLRGEERGPLPPPTTSARLAHRSDAITPGREFIQTEAAVAVPRGALSNASGTPAGGVTFQLGVAKRAIDTALLVAAKKTRKR